MVVKSDGYGVREPHLCNHIQRLLGNLDGQLDLCQPL
jgi:hypothetical protein